jgi:hypothetical protein
MSRQGTFQKLSADKVAMIRLRYHTRASTQTAMAKEYGVSFFTIHYHIRSCKATGYPLGDAINDACIAWRAHDYTGFAASLRRAADMISNSNANS